MKNKSLKNILGNKIAKISTFFFIQILIVFAFTSYKIKEGKVDEIKQSMASLIDAHTPMILNELIEKDQEGLNVRISLINMRHKRNGVHFEVIKNNKQSFCNKGYICSHKKLKYFEKSYGFLKASQRSPDFLGIFLSSGIVAVLVLISLFFVLINRQLFKTIKKLVIEPIKELSSQVQTDQLVKTNALTLNSSKEISQLTNSIENYKKEINAHFEKEISLKEFEIMSKVSSQISHDLASPLAALSIISKSLDELPDSKKKLLNVSIARTREIAGKLKNLNKENLKFQTLDKSNENIFNLINDVILEKKAKHAERKNLNIIIKKKSLNNFYSTISAVEFKRVISNLIENSIEACRNAPIIHIDLEAFQNERFKISIKDNGSGITKDNLSKVTQRGKTFGKENGSGLGLYHAQCFAEANDGKLFIDSNPGVGTQVSMLLNSTNGEESSLESPSELHKRALPFKAFLLLLITFSFNLDIYSNDYNLDKALADRIRVCGKLLAELNENPRKAAIADKTHIVDLNTPRFFRINDNSFLGIPLSHGYGNRMITLIPEKKVQLSRGKHIDEDSFEILEKGIDGYKEELLRSGLSEEIVNSIEDAENSEIESYIQIESQGKAVAFSSAHAYTPHYRILPFMKKAQELGFSEDPDIKAFINRLHKQKSKGKAVIEIGTTFISSDFNANDKKRLHLLILFWMRTRLIEMNRQSIFVSHIADPRFARFLQSTFGWKLETRVKDQLGNTHYLLSIESETFTERIDVYLDENLNFDSEQ